MAKNLILYKVAPSFSVGRDQNQTLINILIKDFKSTRILLRTDGSIFYGGDVTLLNQLVHFCSLLTYRYL